MLTTSPDRPVRPSSFRRFVLACALFGLAPLASVGAQDAPRPFDTASAPSEQTRFNGAAPQLVGVASGDSLTVAWQHYAGNTPASAKLTRFRRSASGLARDWEKQLPLPRLVGMTTDGSSFYAVSAAAEDLALDVAIKTFRQNVLVMTKYDDRGSVVWQKDLNNATYLGDDGKAGSPIYSPLKDATGVVAYGGGKIVVALGTNTAPDPNLPASGQRRHQRAQYFVVGQDGAGFQAASETSWRHSFDQRLVFDGTDFVFMDLADAGWYMPGGGVSLRKIKPTNNGATFAGGGLEGVYAYVRQAESEGGQNFTFTSLGDVQVGANGYTALFTSERNNKITQRGGWSQPVAEPRDLGLVHVKKSFDTIQEGSWDGNPTSGNIVIKNSDVSAIKVSRSVVDSGSTTVTTFQHPTNPAKTFTQTGIVWLTSLAAGVSAERPKLVKIADNRYIAAWEEWTYSGSNLGYQSTKAMLLDEYGTKLSQPTSISARLNPSGADRPFVSNGSAAWIAGNASTGALTLHSLDSSLRLTSTALSQSSAPAVSTDRLEAGATLLPGQAIKSPDGRFTLTYQTDGNLVLYDASGKALWSSKTFGRSAGRAVMQSDGNFVIYGANNEFVWNTGTTSAGSKLVLQNDGNLVVYRADGGVNWTSGTAQAATISDRLHEGDILLPNEKIQSPDRRYTLVYQPDGNLVLYDAAMQALWSSRTFRSSVGHTIMESNGALTIYGANEQLVWSTATASPGSQLVLQNDANLVIYSAAGRAVWASNTAR